MKCTNHPDSDAVGLCISCAKPVCTICGLKINGETYCKECSAKKAGSIQSQQQKSPSLAAILSLVIGGVGQIYNGQIGKGLLIFFTSWLIVPWIYGIYDAYKTAEKINLGEISVSQRPGCAIAAIAVMIIIPFLVVFLAIILAIAIPAFMTVRGSAENTICVNNLRYISQIKEMYASENGLIKGAIIISVDNNGIDDNDGIPDVLEQYFEKPLQCLAGGAYIIGAVGETPQCSIGDKGTADTKDDHVITE